MGNVHVDPHRYSQILINLLTNALKASKPKTTVQINLTKTKTKWTLEVQDEGYGIPKKDLPFVFERFYRADDSRNRKTGGLGVGLSIVKELVNVHNGAIQIQSEEKHGTRVRCEFPI